MGRPSSRAERALRRALVTPAMRLLDQVQRPARRHEAAGRDARPSAGAGERAIRSSGRWTPTSATCSPTWFDVGFLPRQRLTWESPASLLEKIIEYEAVHEIRSWADLRHRLDGDRRCYAFFHPSLPREPLIFVQVALVEGFAGDRAAARRAAPAARPRARGHRDLLLDHQHPATACAASASATS